MHKLGNKLIPRAFLGLRFGKSDVQKKYEADRKAAITARYGDLSKDKAARKWAEKDYDKNYVASESGTNFNYTAPTVGNIKANESGEDYYNRFKQESGMQTDFDNTLKNITESLNKRFIDNTPKLVTPTASVTPVRRRRTTSPKPVDDQNNIQGQGPLLLPGQKPYTGNRFVDVINTVFNGRVYNNTRTTYPLRAGQPVNRNFKL